MQTFLPLNQSLCFVMYIAEASDGGVVLREAKKFLIRYLKDVRTTSLALGRREVSSHSSVWRLLQSFFLCQDIDTSLLKLLAEDHAASLVPYITNHDLHLSFEESKAALEEHKVN